MPQTLLLIGQWIAAAWASIGTIGQAVVLTALNVGISALLRPSAPKPEDVQSSFRQATAARVRHVGRVKAAGPWAFGESEDGNFHKVLTIGQGEIDGYEEYWVDDRLATLDADGWVIDPSPIGDGETIRIQSRRGLPTETHYADLTAVFPEWTSDHRGDGVASIYAYFDAVSAERLSEVYPNLINTNIRAVLRGVKVWNPVTAVTEWSDNAAAIIRDFMTHQDGMRLPEEIFTTPQAQAGWEAAFNRAAESVPLKAGGNEARYRIWGSYYLNERPGDVLARMLAACDGRIYPTPDGGITLNIGTWAEPTVVLDEDAITGFSDLSRGRDVMETANVIRATYLQVDGDYQSGDADPWVDEDDVSERGEIERDLPLTMSPSHGQARRLMKLESYRANPEWIGTFNCNLRGLAAIGERFVRIQYPLFGIDEVFEVQDLRFVISEGNILTGVQLSVISLPAEAYDWDAASEEGTAPNADETVVDRTIPVPTGFAVVQVVRNVGGSPYPFGRLSWDAPPGNLNTEARGRKSGDASWQSIPVDMGQASADSFMLEDGVEYEFQVRHVSVTGRAGDWTASETLNAVADGTAPGVVTGVAVTPGIGTASIAWTSPNSANYVAANIRRNTVNDEGAATLVRTEYGPPSSADAWQDSGLTAGSYYYWLKSINGSGIESASVATGAVSVT